MQTILYSGAQKSMQPQQTTDTFDKVVTWAAQWRVAINRDTTTGTLFTLSPNIQPGILTLDDTPLKIQEQKTYLGVTFDKELPGSNIN